MLRSSTANLLTRRVACFSMPVATNSFFGLPRVSFSNHEMQRFLLCSQTTISLRNYGFGKPERGKPRISFEERQARRIPKTREQKQAAEQRKLESEQYIDTELPDICASHAETIKAKAEQSIKRVVHPVAALLDVEIDLQGQQKPLSQLATVVKISAREYEIIPNSAAFVNAIVLRLSRHDSTLQPHKHENTKVRITIQPTTKSMRQRAADYVRELGARSHKHFQIVRRNAMNTIEEFELPEDLTTMRKTAAEEIINKSSQDLNNELEEIAQAILNVETPDEDDENESTEPQQK